MNYASVIIICHNFGDHANRPILLYGMSGVFSMRTAEFDELGCTNKNEHGGVKAKYGKSHTNGKSTSSHDSRVVLSPLVCGDVFPYTPPRCICGVEL